jgi:hypothetical protein
VEEPNSEDENGEAGSPKKKKTAAKSKKQADGEDGEEVKTKKVTHVNRSAFSTHTSERGHQSQEGSERL